MNVELVNVTTRDGLRLDGLWRKPDAGISSRLGVDLVVLHHGVGGNFYGAGMFEGFSEALLEQGCAVLRVNNRGHDGMSRAVIGEAVKGIGAAYESMEECPYDWAAWVDFAQDAGYQNIGLWGHSLGATKSIYYMATEGDSRVKCVVAGSPPRFSYSAYSSMQEGEEFLRLASRAQKCIDDGHPKTLIDTPYPLPLILAAEVFVEKYGPEERFNVLKHLPNVRSPLLVMIGTEEAQTMMGFRGLPAEVEKLAGELDHLTFESIPGADHAYTNQREYVWGVVSRWLEKV
ncbi:MAG: hypothetical protein BZY88_04715 [SAR202 cluster bacterium Io17-Chloro-G9]|nr:MAG: hypothetical protein BZY88_04715 [SAR202 cluster bacterium Io17-Chloro-G9]